MENELNILENEFFEYLESNNYKSCKNIIEQIEIKNLSISSRDYLSALYYDEELNPDYDIDIAKNYYRKLFKDGNSSAYAFLRLAHYTETVSQKIKILNKGLIQYPESEMLYYSLISISDDKECIYKKLSQKNINSDRIRKLMFSFYLSAENYREILDIIDTLEYTLNETQLFLKLIKGVSLWSLNKYKLSFSILKEILEVDLSYSLELAPHFVQINNLIELKKTNLASQVFEDIPLHEHNIYSISNSELNVCFDFTKIVEKTLNRLAYLITKRSLKSKLFRVRGLFYYYEKNKVKFGDLKFARKYYGQDFEIYAPLINCYLEKNKYVEANRVCLDWIKNSFLPLPSKNIDYYSNYDFITESDEKQFQTIFEEVQQFSKNSSKRMLIAETLLRPIIKRLFKEKKYQLIVDLSNAFGIYDLQNSNSLFEIAYSYSEVDNPQKGEEYYSRYLEKNGSSSAALNNLGVIYEHNNELDRALDYFNKALSIDSKNVIYIRNIDRVENRIQAVWDEEIQKTSKWLSSKKLAEIGYTRQYVLTIDRSFEKDYSNNLLRDIRESAIALTLENFKSAIVMSGSAIESILLYLLKQKKISTYQLTNHKVSIIEAGLNDLLEISFREKLISKNLFHFAQAIKDFRNVIHPGVEQRKKSIRVDKENANLSWIVLKKLIDESTQ